MLYAFTAWDSGDGDGPGPIIFDAQGALYGTTMYGGTFDFGTVFKLTPNEDGSWSESILFDFTAVKRGGVRPEGGVIFDVAGSLYGTTYFGGSKKSESCPTGGCGTVFKLTPNSDGGWNESTLHEFTGGRDGLNPGDALTFDAAGNLYGATGWGAFQGCGSTCGAIFRLTPNSDGSWTTHILHSFTGGKDGGWAEGGGLTLDAAGNLYGQRSGGGAYGKGVVFKLTPQSTGGWKERVLHAFSGTPGRYPSGGVIFDAAGDLYGTAETAVFEITP